MADFVVVYLANRSIITVSLSLKEDFVCGFQEKTLTPAKGEFCIYMYNNFVCQTTNIWQTDQSLQYL